MRKALVVVALGALVAVAGSTQSFAACAAPVPMFHAYDGYFACADGRPVSAYAYQVSAPTTVNTGSLQIACEAFDPTGGVCSTPSAGDVGDGKVTIVTDWSTPGVNGCPVDAAGGHRVAIVVQAADGTGFIASITGANADFGYSVELAGPADLTPLACGSNNSRPDIISRVVSGSAVTLGLHFSPVKIFSDCDPDSFGFAVGACVDTPPTAAPGLVYTSVQKCSNTNDTTGAPVRPDLSTGKWTSTGVRPDASGNAQVTAQIPSTPGDCLYVGAGTNIGGQDSSGITGFISWKGSDPLPASPTATDIASAKAQGKINIAWKTLSETGLVGFEIHAVDRKGEFKVGSFIAASGKASSYKTTIGLGEFKSARQFVIVSVMADGTQAKSAVKGF